MVKLSKRLTAVAACVPEGARLADIGSDHAKVPLFLDDLGRIDFGIAGEVAMGPYSIAKEAISGRENLTARLANGLEAFSDADNIDCVVIAGMGGILISEILSKYPEKLSNPDMTLVLQPNNEEEQLRRDLTYMGWRLVYETIFEDKGKIYELMVACHGKSHASGKDLRFGGKDVRQSPVFREKWTRRLDELHKISRLTHQRRDDIAREIKEIEAILDEN